MYCTCRRQLGDWEISLGLDCVDDEHPENVEHFRYTSYKYNAILHTHLVYVIHVKKPSTAKRINNNNRNKNKNKNGKTTATKEQES